VAAALTCLLAWAIARRKLGGINGDLLGGANQLVELSVLLAGVVVFSTR
jgi:cobalamin synthase